jgi:hypothetical protein
MNVVYFITHQQRRPQYLAVCQCGTRHGPYAKVALIPDTCAVCEDTAVAQERKNPLTTDGR